MFETIKGGNPIPPHTWMRATDVLIDYSATGEKWINAGKPKDGILYREFCLIEKEYNQMADALWFAKWTDEQREEWNRIYTYTKC